MVITGILAVAGGSALNFLPSLRWYAAGQEPTPQRREAAMHVPRRQTLLLATVWALSAVAVLVANHTAAAEVALLIVPAVFFGATAAILTSLLLTVRTLRPITAAAVPAKASRDTAPGVMARLLSVWVLISALPSLGIALLILARSHGWMIDRSTSVEIPVLVLLAVAVMLGPARDDPGVPVHLRSGPRRRRRDGRRRTREPRSHRRRLRAIRNRPPAKRIQPYGDRAAGA